ncbi:MAG TPA: T9SS type A sorting domain-containing protein [Flavobacterium sp.]
MKKIFTLFFILITVTNGYSNFNTSLIITSQPVVTTDCTTQSGIIKIIDNGGNSYKWEVSTNGGSIWSSVVNSATYSGATTNTLSITGATNGYQYRVELTDSASSMSVLSNVVSIIMASSPIVKNVTIERCDSDLDGRTTFDLTTVNNMISSNSFMETFTYYTSSIGASTANPTELILNPTAYTNPIPYVMDVWVKVENMSGCFSVARITLRVGVGIPSAFTVPVSPVCDDDHDGVATFDLMGAKATIETLLPSIGYTITYYRNQTDAFAQTNAITNISSYRNIGYPNTQQIWVRVNNTIDPACFSAGPYITLNVEALPVANFIGSYATCDDNQDGIFTFNTVNLEATLLGGQTNKIVTYFNHNGVPMAAPFPATFTTTTQIIKAVVSNNSMLGCYSETFISFIVNPLPFDSVIVSGSDLTAMEIGASYQWYKCPNTLLDGETNQSYLPTVDGDYKVEITSLVSNCSVTSDCVTFSSLGVKDINGASQFVLYPNPTTGILNIESNIEDNFTVFNQLGQVVKTVKVNVGTNKVNLENLVDGVYFLKNKSGENQVIKKIIKN